MLMRSRKPCVLARRRLFGWKVRFIGVSPRFVNRVANEGRYLPSADPSRHEKRGNTMIVKRLSKAPTVCSGGLGFRGPGQRPMSGICPRSTGSSTSREHPAPDTIGTAGVRRCMDRKSDGGQLDPAPDSLGSVQSDSSSCEDFVCLQTILGRGRAPSRNRSPFGLRETTRWRRRRSLTRNFKSSRVDLPVRTLTSHGFSGLFHFSPVLST